jgi:hypothetical protein
VHHDGVHADQLQQHHVSAKSSCDVGHRVAAVLDDDGAIVEALM